MKFGICSDLSNIESVAATGFDYIEGHVTKVAAMSEAEFEELCEFLRREKLEKVGVFTFSPQEGTVAAGLPGQLDDETKNARAERIDFIQDEIMQERAESLVGKTVRVLCEGFDRIAEIWYGRSFAESPDIDGKIFFTAEKGRVRAGAFADVVIDSEEDGEPVGRAV